MGRWKANSGFEGEETGISGRFSLSFLLRRSPRGILGGGLGACGDDGCVGFGGRARAGLGEVVATRRSERG